MEQRAVEILRNDPQMRMEFLKLRGGSHRAHPIRVRLDSLMTAQRGVQDKHTRARSSTRGQRSVKAQQAGTCHTSS
jgi:hypothetical protein